MVESINEFWRKILFRRINFMVMNAQTLHLSLPERNFCHSLQTPVTTIGINQLLASISILIMC